jgi:Fe-S oxidoreductase
MTSNNKIDSEKTVFAPGCALMLYKPELAEKIHLLLNANLGEMDKLMICCHHDPQFSEKTKVVNVCPGCDKRYENDYTNSSTISLWEILAQNDFFLFPDYHGKTMSIIDACPTREKEKVQTAIRTLLNKMNIKLVEPKHTREKSICCGDSFYDVIPTEKVKEQMKKRTSEMPAEDVVVYCVSCIKSVFIGGKKPRYLVDLLFAEETVPQTYEPDEWHKELNEYMEQFII